jgi:hypothetical protein
MSNTSIIHLFEQQQNKLYCTLREKKTKEKKGSRDEW